MELFLSQALGVVVISTILPLYRAIKGPASADRILAVNVLTTLITICIALLAFVAGEQAYLDVALVLVLCGFVATVAILRALVEKGG